ncbi:MAG: ATP-binding response regulator [Chloroflexota bacterium]
MSGSVLWQTTPSPSQAQLHLRELQAGTTRLFFVLTVVSYFTLHPFISLTLPVQQAMRFDTLLLIVVPVLGGTYLLLPGHGRLAAWVLVLGLLGSASWALYYVAEPGQANTAYILVYIMAAMMAALLISTRGGLLVAASSVGLLSAIATFRVGVVGPADALQTGLFAGLAVVAVWSLTRHLLITLDWYASSYVESEQRMKEAREHRAEAVQARKQLDIALQRLERANAALQVAWKTANEAERARMEFATNISHELRTPLNLIVGYTEMMLTSPASYGGKPLPSSYRGDLSAVYRSAQHLLGLTDDVLDLARMEVGRLGLFMERVDLRQVVNESATLIDEFIEAKGLELRLILPAEVPPVLADRLRVRQVLLNLLTNAARFTERGWIQVEMRCREGEVRMVVSDTGPGLSAADLGHVFQPFVSRDKPRPDWHGGTGIGLSISKRFIELHGGEMGVESTLGVGTSFSFTLPVSVEKTERLAEGRIRRLQPRPAAQEQVLVLAHDDRGLAKLLSRHLEGFRVEVADGAASAGTVAAELGAAAVVADFDAAIDAESCRVPVIRCPLPHARKLVKRLQVADYLVKPVSRESLLAAIRNLNRPVERILLVDDDSRFVRLLARMLKSRGLRFQIETAHDGEEALVRVRTFCPDLVLLDLAMPGMDGLSLLGRLEEAEGDGRRDVIVVSGYQEGERDVPLGDEVLIRKPDGFRLQEIVQLIGAAVATLPVRPPAVASEPALRQAPLG